MAISYTTTHSFSGFIKLIYLFLGFSVFGVSALLVSELIRSELLAVIIGFIILLLFLQTTGRLFQNIGVFLYCTFSLKTNVNWNEVDYLAPLFLENNYGKWYPMEHIKDLPKSIRKKELLKQADIIFNKDPIFNEEL